MKALAGIALFVVGACASAPPTAQAPSAVGSADSASAVASASPDTAASAAPSAASSTASTDAPSTAPPPAAAAPLTVVPMKLVAAKLGHKVEIKVDGTVVLDGKPSWKITGTGLFELKHPDQPLLAVAGDGTVTGFMVEAKDQLHFDDKDNLADSGGGSLSIGDDGTISLPDKAKADFGAMKLTGFDPSARRAASLVVAQVLMGAAMEKGLSQMKANLKKGQH
jgi:hypothetical protein